MAVTRISPKRQITIPIEIFKDLRLDRGDYLEAKVEGSRIVLIPTKLIPKDQAWFWTRSWQEKEQEAEENINAGKLSGPLASGKALVRSLKQKR